MIEISSETLPIIAFGIFLLALVVGKLMTVESPPKNNKKK